MLNVLPVTIVYFETPFAPPLSPPIPFHVTATAAVGSGQKTAPHSIILFATNYRCRWFFA